MMVRDSKSEKRSTIRSDPVCRKEEQEGESLLVDVLQARVVSGSRGVNVACPGYDVMMECPHLLPCQR